MDIQYTSVHRSPGGGEGRVTEWRRESNPQPADLRRRDQRPRPLGHPAPSGTPFHTHTDTYLHIHQNKKVIIASNYPKEMLTVLVIFLII